jgi:hypothetical protein
MRKIILVGVASRSGRAQAPRQTPTPGTSIQLSEVTHGPEVYKLEEAYLNWRLAPSEQMYAVIDGKRLHSYVEHLAAISRRYRDQGHPQYWGRIQGTSGDAETAQWMFDKFKQAGIEARLQSFDLPPQWIPQSWEVTGIADGKTVKMATAWPSRSSGTQGKVLDLEGVYVGLGNPGDFAGRDVRGKAVVIYTMPQPGPWSSSARFNGSLQRAREHGAAAIFLVIALPGNVTAAVGAAPPAAPATTPAVAGTASPAPLGFTLGFQDGEALRELIEQAPAGKPARVQIRLDVPMVSGLKTANVWGVLPGMTDEKIMIIAHRDGYFDSSGDNASGVAAMVGLAEYFAKIPKEKRRRTIEFVGTPGHHGGSVGAPWIAANKDTTLVKTALIMNLEHLALAQTEYFSGKMRFGNTMAPQLWSFNGSRQLIDIGIKAFAAFGVPTFTGTDRVAMAEALSLDKLAPSFGTMSLDTYYHTDHETPATVAWTGLGAITRAFAKMIDDVNTIELKALQPGNTH